MTSLPASEIHLSQRAYRPPSDRLRMSIMGVIRCRVPYLPLKFQVEFLD